MVGHGIKCTPCKDLDVIHVANTSTVGSSLLCFYFYLLYYAAVLLNLAYYAQLYAQE